GAGKSTLLRAMAGLQPLTKGRVFVDGRVSLLGVNAALIPELTGAQNIMLGGLALGLTPSEVNDRYDEIVEFSGIGAFVNMPMNILSTGMAGRLRFSISSASIPDVMMIDESLATGDRAFREKCARRMDEIRQAAGTVILVSHSMADIRRNCTRA